LTVSVASVVSVNVGEQRDVEWFGRIARTAVWKEPVAGRIAVRGVYLAGVDQADRRVHGGPDKAVYAYALADYAWWSRVFRRPAGRAGRGRLRRTVRLAGRSYWW
jgi:MOSC domain-containing protein YiiM